MCFIKSPLRGHLEKKRKRKEKLEAMLSSDIMSTVKLSLCLDADRLVRSASRTGKQSAPAVCTYFLSVNNGTQTQPLPPSPALHPSFTLLCPSHFSIHTLFSHMLAARWLPEKLSPVAQTPQPSMRQMNSINRAPQTQLLIFSFVLDF